MELLTTFPSMGVYPEMPGPDFARKIQSLEKIVESILGIAFYNLYYGNKEPEAKRIFDEIIPDK